MRLAPLFALLALAPALHAQADPTPPELYFPLAVGNQWEYRGSDVFSGPRSFERERRTVVRDTVVGGERWFVLRTQTFRELSDRWEAAGDVRVLLRFDVASANVVLRGPSGAERPLFSCRLDAPLAADEVACAPPADYPRYTKRTETVLGIGTRALMITTGYTGVRLAASIGVFQEAVEGVGADLVYARAGGAVFGTPIAGMPGLPDPTPPEAYFPLAVGNRWEYRETDKASGPGTPYRQRRTVVRDTLVGGETWAVLRTQRFRVLGGAGGLEWTPQGEQRALVRFDTASATVVQRMPDGRVEPLVRCRLDGPLTGDGAVACDSQNALPEYSKRADTEFGIPTTVLYISTGMGGIRLAAGIGPVSESVEFRGLELLYARVGGVEVGTPIEGMPNVPDPTPPEDYYPLAVGNEWQYEDCVQDGAPCNIRHEYVRRTVEREAVVAGTRYFVEVERRYTTTSVPLGQSERLLRFAGATLVRRDGASDVPVSCPLDADFDATVACPGMFDGMARVAPRNAGQIAQAEKVFVIGSDLWYGYTAGVGLVGQQFWTSPFTLRYARVGGAVVFGSAIVAGETDAAPAAALALRAAPNPTAGALVLTLTLPEAQTVAVEAFDALGRRVWQQSAALAAGPQTVAVDASAWAPGVYVVRATAGRTSATARLVRR